MHRWVGYFWPRGRKTASSSGLKMFEAAKKCIDSERWGQMVDRCWCYGGDAKTLFSSVVSSIGLPSLRKRCLVVSETSSGVVNFSLYCAYGNSRSNGNFAVSCSDGNLMDDTVGAAEVTAVPGPCVLSQVWVSLLCS